MAAVARYRVVAGPRDPVFDRVTELIGQVFEAPMAFVSIVDEDRIWLVSTLGLGELRQVGRDQGLCAAPIEDDVPYVVTDARTDVRTAANRFVAEYGIGFYACAPLVTFDGHRLGAVSVMDTAARAATDAQLAILSNTAAIVMEQLELRLSSTDALRSERGRSGGARAALGMARRDRDAARRARDTAQVAHDRVLADRDEARAARDEARVARDEARLDRDTAERERDVIEEYAGALQQVLLPPLLPTIRGLSLAAHYHPASPRQIGGDFYDVFALGGDRWALFIGDVMGHGTQAAIVTSLIRYTLRSAALHHADPVEALRELNQVMLREVAPRRFCTVSLCTLERLQDHDGGFQVVMATGGHEPALLLDDVTKTAVPVRSTAGALVGATPNAVFEACHVQVRTGQTLLFYTDGLVEARRGQDPFDHASLVEFAAQRTHLPAPDLVDDLRTFIPKLNPDDDVAVLALTATPPARRRADPPPSGHPPRLP